MPRRSKRLLEKNMSTDGINTSGDSPAHSDNEKTIIEQDEPSVAELKDEILALKNSLKQLLDRSNNITSAAGTPTYTEQLGATKSENVLPDTSNVSHAVAASYLSNITTTPASTAPMQQQQNLKISEYNMLPQYNLPQFSTAAPSFVPLTSLPYYATQPFAPTTLPSASLPYTVAPSLVSTATSMPFLPTSFDYLRQPSTRIYTSAPSRMTPATSAYMNAHVTGASNMPELHHANDSRQLRKLHDLPQFSGQPEQWPMFIVTFRETTTNYNYSNLENLIRLQKSLKGEARDKVEAFLIHPDSVNHVVSTLEFHYGRPQVLIRSQIAKVRAFPSIHE